MDERTELLIRELAEKLGTTADGLWQVLVAQAAISGAIGLGLTFAWLAALFFAAKYAKSKTTGDDPDWKSEEALFSWLTVAILAVLILAISSATISGNISAIINPEYWALMQLKP